MRIRAEKMDIVRHRIYDMAAAWEGIPAFRQIPFCHIIESLDR